MVTANSLNANSSTPFEVPNGGTGASSLTNQGILLGQGASAFIATAALTDGQLLIGSTGLSPVPASLTAGSNITITPGAGSVTIAASASFLPWTTVGGTSQSMSVDNGYRSTSGSSTTFTLPTTAAQYTTIRVAVDGSGAVAIAQNAGQNVRFGNQISTTGAGGSLTSTSQGDCLELLCTVADTSWVVLSSVGAWNVV